MTIHDPSLRAALKTLKLTGMLDTLMPASPRPATGNADTWSSCRCSAKTKSPAATPPP